MAFIMQVYTRIFYLTPGDGEPARAGKADR